MLRDRLGLIASFGYEVGRGLQQLLGQDPFSSRSGPELCCLLNTGVSLFDLQCDRGPGGAMELGAVFDEDTLADLIAKPHACRALAARADLTAELELRVLLKIIAQVFARLHEGRRPGREDAWGIMATLLANAYRAQVLHGAAKADRLRSAEVKSTAPFYLMVEVFRVLSTAADDTWPRIHRLVGDMAVAFWLVDDVADLLRDVSSGAANSILLRVASGEPADRVIEEVVDRVVAALRDTSALLLTLGGDALAFRWIVLCYVRSWLR